MPWGATLSPTARRDVEALVDVGLRAAEQVVARGRWLRPIPLALDFGGAVRELDFDAADLPQRTPAALTNAATYLLAQHAPQAKAVALVTGSRLDDGRGDVIEVWVEHREGEALTVLRPYRHRGGRPRLGEPRAYTGSRLIWAARPA